MSMASQQITFESSKGGILLDNQLATCAKFNVMTGDTYRPILIPLFLA